MSNVLIRTENLSKSYGDIQVLSDISLTVGYHEIVGIAGENGAGKSTILKLLSGVISPSVGQMFLKEKPYGPANYRDAVTQGVSMVFQEQALIGNLRIYENIFYGFENQFSRLGVLLDHTRMRREAQDKLQSLGFGHIDAATLTDELPFHERQMVEIARAFILSEYTGITHPLILLDEPTAAIGEREITLLFDAVRRLKEKASFMIVTHKLSEYIELCDRIYVFKDGGMAGELSHADCSANNVQQLMVGRTRDETLYHEEQQRTVFGESRLAVANLSGAGLSDFSLNIASGEIVGLSGLIGCGKETVVRAIVGHHPFPETGTITLCGKSLPVANRTANTKSLGLGYIPKERKAEGIVGYLSVANNISLASLENVSPIPKIISPAKETRQALDFIEQLSIKTRGPDQDAVYLSGGNQQKLVLAKWLARKVTVMVLDNPTRGVDVGAKAEIYQIIRGLTKEGVAILLVSDDLLELIGLSNRISVMREGRISAEIEAPAAQKPTEHDIVRYMT